MVTMKLMQKYTININGRVLSDVEVVGEWNGMIELNAGLNKGKLIVRRKDWNNGKEWQREANAFMEQELELLYADDRLGLPKTEVVLKLDEQENDQ